MKNNAFKKDLGEISSYDLPWKKLYGKTVLVTGASGFIASYIVETLLYINDTHAQSNIRVICLVRNKKNALKKFSFNENREDVVFWEQDVVESIYSRKEHIDYIIHAASYATPSKYGIDPVGTLLPNAIGTYHLLEYARQKPLLGFLFISSCEIYGDVGNSNGQISEEDKGALDPIELRSCYAESKRMGETMCMSWYAQYQVLTKVARLFHTYGPKMSLSDGRVHSDFVGSIVSNNTIMIKSDGNARRAFSYIVDSITGLFTILLKGEVGQAYNVGNNTLISIKDLAYALVSYFPERKLRIITQLRDHSDSYLSSKIHIQSPNLDKIESLGYKPRYTLREGFKRTIDSFTSDQ